MIKTCESHGEYESQSIEVLGNSVSTACPRCLDEMEVAKAAHDAKAQATDRDRIHKVRVKAANIPEKYLKWTLGDCKKLNPNEVQEAYEWIMRGKTGRSMLINGPIGTAKTTLACCLLSVWCHDSMGIFTSMFAMSKDSMDRESGTGKYINIPLLVIDEAGRQMGTDAEKNRIFEIINERYNAERPTIFIGNQRLTEFEQAMGLAVYDRIQENLTTITLTGESLRKG